MLARPLRVLLVEDNPTDALLVEVALEEMTAFAPSLTHVESLAEAERALQTDFDVALVDLNLPDGQGLDNFVRLQQKAPLTPMIVLTGLADEELALEAIARGAADYLIKGATDAPLLERSTRYAIERKKNENNRLELARVQIARDEAEANNQAKDEFLATLSHELRTPLNAIMGWASLLGTGQLDEETSRQAIETIERNARVQAQLIEDLLDVSRIIAGNFKLELCDLDLGGVVRAAADTLTPSLSAKKIDVEFDLEPIPPVRGDAMRLQQVAWNLLSNAIKFSPQSGRILLQVQQEIGADGVNEAVFRVRDSGQGIAAEFLPFVFERFRQADGSTTRRHGGLGLGLTIVRNVVELHGGRVAAQSDGLEQGSMFSVWLPLAASQSETENLGATRAPQWNGIEILAVDDQEDSRDFVRLLFETLGARVQTASSAAQALEIIEKSPPHLMVSDIGMPDEDGYNLIKTVRERHFRFPAIALTGFMRSGERASANQAGFQEFISKPVDPRALSRMAAGLLGFEN